MWSYSEIHANKELIEKFKENCEASQTARNLFGGIMLIENNLLHWNIVMLANDKAFCLAIYADGKWNIGRAIQKPTLGRLNLPAIIGGSDDEA